MQEDATLKRRLAVDERGIKRLYSQWLAYARSAKASDAAREKRVAQAALQMGVRQFAAALRRHGAIANAHREEQRGCQQSRAEIERAMERVRGEISDLQTQLKEAQRVREFKQKLNNQAREIECLPTAADSQQAVAAMRDTIEFQKLLLLQYASTHSVRVREFQHVMAAIAAYKTAVSDEMDRISAHTVDDLEALRQHAAANPEPATAPERTPPPPEAGGSSPEDGEVQSRRASASTRFFRESSHDIDRDIDGDSKAAAA